MTKAGVAPAFDFDWIFPLTCDIMSGHLNIQARENHE